MPSDHAFFPKVRALGPRKTAERCKEGVVSLRFASPYSYICYTILYIKLYSISLFLPTWAGFHTTVNDMNFIPQIAIAIGVLTSNRGGGRRTTLADWTWHQGAIAGRHCRVLLGGDDGEPTLREWTWHRLLLQGAIAGLGGMVVGQLWRIDLAPGCHIAGKGRGW